MSSSFKTSTKEEDNFEEKDIEMIIDKIENNFNSEERSIIIKECLDNGFSLADLTVFGFNIDMDAKFGVASKVLNVFKSHKNFTIFSDMKKPMKDVFSIGSGFVRFCGSPSCELVRDAVNDFILLSSRALCEIDMTTLSNGLEKAAERFMNKKSFNENDIKTFKKIFDLLVEIDFRIIEKYENSNEFDE